MGRFRTAKEARINELKLQLSTAVANRGLMRHFPTTDPEKVAQADDRVASLEAQIAALEAEPEEPPVSDIQSSLDFLSKLSSRPQPASLPQSHAPSALEQCKSIIGSLPDADRQQLVLWIARGMPKGE